LRSVGRAAATGCESTVDDMIYVTCTLANRSH